jgi:hypothetical protein
MTSSDQTERLENPHRQAARPPVLTPHAFRPGSFGAGVALTALGVVFLLQQLGDVALGPVTTVAIVTLAAAALLVAVAIGWSRRAPAPVADDETEDDSGESPAEA